MDNKKQLAMTRTISKVSAWQDLFLDEQGNLTDKARIVIDELAEICYAESSPLEQVNKAEDLFVFEGQRRVFLHIMGQLNINIVNLYDQLKKQKKLDSTRYGNNN